MKQVVQEARSGSTTVREIPAPLALPGQVVVATIASLLSLGTERAVVELSRRSLLGKALERPDLVQRTLRKLRQEGLASTARQVIAKLDEPIPLGYSSAGVVLECGARVDAFRPGDRVATAGPHAGIVSVGVNLCARIPEGVSFEQAAYTSIGAAALQGVRLARVELGDRVLVIGLGLLGQIAACLLRAQGCRVFGVDVDPHRLALAAELGADAVAAGEPLDEIRAFSRGHGVDAVVIAASTQSNAPLDLAAAAARERGRIVLVGVVGLGVPRAPFFEKELEFTVSSSLGPGRLDPAYAERGVDYPPGRVRWTAQRNMEAVLETIAAGQLPVERLTTHRFPIERATEAYELITGDRGAAPAPLGVLLEYPAAPARPPRRVPLRASGRGEGGRGEGGLGVSVIGTGNFARLTALPLLDKVPGLARRGLCSARGMSAEHSGRGRGYAFAATDPEEIWGDAGTDAILVLTRHDTHADLVVAALRAGKHVLVEKPLCVSLDELARIAACVEALGERCPVLMVGHNRRFSLGAEAVRGFFAGAAPLCIAYRFAAPPLLPEHWARDEEASGGRIVGEASHAIDTCVALAGSAPGRVHAESAIAGGGAGAADARVFLTMRHRDGSASCVSYQTGGDPSFPAERIEVFGGGRTAVVEGWDDIALWSGGRATRVRGKHDLGHQAALEAFVAACRTGRWPVPWAELHAVAEASLLAVRSLREGVPQRCGEALGGLELGAEPA